MESATVLMLDRKNLRQGFEKIKFKKVNLDSFSTNVLKEFPNYDLVIFSDFKNNNVRVLKNRYGCAN